MTVFIVLAIPFVPLILGLVLHHVGDPCEAVRPMSRAQRRRAERAADDALWASRTLGEINDLPETTEPEVRL